MEHTSNTMVQFNWSCNHSCTSTSLGVKCSESLFKSRFESANQHLG